VENLLAGIFRPKSSNVNNGDTLFFWCYFNKLCKEHLYKPVET